MFEFKLPFSTSIVSNLILPNQNYSFLPSYSDSRTMKDNVNQKRYFK